MEIDSFLKALDGMNDHEVVVQPLDPIFALAIDKYCKMLGYEQAFNILSVELSKRLDGMQRSLQSLDGGFATEVGEIIRRYPQCRIKYEPSTGDGLGITVEVSRSEITDEELSAFQAEVMAAFDKYKLVPLKNVALRLTKSIHSKSESD